MSIETATEFPVVQAPPAPLPLPVLATPAGPALTGVEKVAIVLMQMSQPAAASVLKHFTEAEAEEIAAEIVKLRSVRPETAESVILEFHEVALRGRRPARGGRDFATELLKASFGDEKAAGLLDRMASTMAGKSFEFLEDVGPEQILGIVEGELPETIALVLAHLKAQSASAVMAGLNQDVRTDVAQAIATMTSASPEAVTIVSDVLKSRAGAVVHPRDQIEVVGGIQPLVDIINRADVETEKALLESLEARDPELAEEIRSRMLTFADLVKLERRDLQQILQGIDLGVLALAMKGSAEPVRDAIEKNISERNRDILRDEIEAVGSVRLSKVEEARAEIVRVIREQEASGKITVRRGEEDEIVY